MDQKFEKDGDVSITISSQMYSVVIVCIPKYKLSCFCNFCSKIVCLDWIFSSGLFLPEKIAEVILHCGFGQLFFMPETNCGTSLNPRWVLYSM